MSTTEPYSVSRRCPQCGWGLTLRNVGPEAREKALLLTDKALRKHLGNEHGSEDKERRQQAKPLASDLDPGARLRRSSCRVFRQGCQSMYHREAAA